MINDTYTDSELGVKLMEIQSEESLEDKISENVKIEMAKLS